MKDKIYRFISYLIPNRLMYWCIIRAFAYTSTHSCGNKFVDDISFTDLCKSWEFKEKYNLNDKAE